MSDSQPPEAWLATSYEWDANLLQACGPVPPVPKRAASAHIPVCQVDGCTADLTNLRRFFRKNGICDNHARADVVVDPAGRQLRFCQQCTKLEPLSNFSSGRRSCRMSLAKRQARAHRGKADSSPERSPERGGTASGRSGTSDGSRGTGSGKGGSSRRSGGASGGLPTKRSRGSSPSRSAGAPVSSPQRSLPPPGLPAMMSIGSSGMGSPMGSVQLPAGHVGAGSGGSPQPAPAPPPQQQQVVGAAAPAPAGGAGRVEQLGWAGKLTESDLEELLRMDPDDLADVLLVPVLAAGAGAKGVPGGAGGATRWLPADGAPPASLTGSHQQLQQATPQLPVGWPQQAAMGAVPTALQAAMHGQHRPAVPGAAGRAAAQPPQEPQGAPAGIDGLFGGHPAAARAHNGGLPQASWDAHPAAAQVAAMQRQASGAGAALEQVYPAHIITRFSLKIFGVSPENLPPALRTELLAALQVSPTVVEGAIRSGCTHLVVDVLLTKEEERQVSAAPRLAAAVRHLHRLEGWTGRGEPPAMVGQLGPLVALGTAAAAGGGSGGGGALPCINLGGAELLPHLCLAGPIATTPSQCGGVFRLAASPLSVGTLREPCHLAAALRCRSHGQLAGMAVSLARPPGLSGGGRGGRAGQPLGPASASASDGEGSGGEEEPGDESSSGQTAGRMQAWVPAAAKHEGCGLYEFELVSGCFLGDAVPVLLLPDAHVDAAAELCQMQAQQAQQGPEALAGAAAADLQRGPAAAAVLRLVGLVLRYLSCRDAAALGGTGGPAVSAFAAAYPPPAAQRVAAVARQLVALAVRARWPATAALLLPAVSADGSSAAAAAVALNALSTPAPSILHLAVASGAAPTVAALRSWADSHSASLAVPPAGTGAAEGGAGEGEAPGVAAGPAPGPQVLHPLLLAAAMGSSLGSEMVGELYELLGSERFAQAADDVGASGRSPRRVAQHTGNAALLAALGPEPQALAEATDVPAQGGPATAATEAAAVSWERGSGELARATSAQAALRKLRGLEKSGEEGSGDPNSALSSPSGPSWEQGKAGAGGSGDGGRANGASKAPAGRHVPSRHAAQPSHDAAVLHEMMQEMCVPPEPHAGHAGHAVQQPSRHGSSQVLATSVVGAAAAVLAALAALALR